MPTPPTSPEPITSKRNRLLVILIGVIVGYVIGHWLEDRLAWENLRILTMTIGGIIAAVIGRLAAERSQ